MSRGRVPTRAKDDPGFTEIMIVIALVVITGIGVASLFGDQIEELFSGKPPEAQRTEQPTSQTRGPNAPTPAQPAGSTTPTPPPTPAK